MLASRLHSSFVGIKFSNVSLSRELHLGYQKQLTPMPISSTVRCSSATASKSLNTTIEAPSLYSILEVEQSVSVSEIKTAYRQMVRRYHPDVCSGSNKENCTQMFLRVQEAYKILSDPDLRADYDHSRLHPFCAQALGMNFSPTVDWSRRRNRGEARDEVSGAWKLQWEAQLYRLKQRKSSTQAGNSAAKSWGARMRQQSSVKD